MTDAKKTEKAGVEVRWLRSDTVRQVGDTETLDRETADDLISRQLVVEV